MGWTAINIIGADVSGTTFGTAATLADNTTDLVTTATSAVDELVLCASVARQNTYFLTSYSGTSKLAQEQHAAQGSFAVGSKPGETSCTSGFTIASSTQSVSMAVPIKPASATAGISIYSWRLRDDTGVEGSGGGGFLADEDVAITASIAGGTSVAVALDANLRIRLGLDEDDSGDPAAGAIQVRAKVNGGTAFDVTSDSTLVKCALSSQFVDGAPTTDHGLTAPAGTFLAGEILETEGITASLDLAQNQRTIVEACVQLLSAGLLVEDTVEFGLRLGGIDYFAGATMVTIVASQPTTVAAGTPGDTTVPLTWADPNATDVPIRPFYRKTADTNWIPEGTLPAGTTAHTFGNLIPLEVSTQYDFGVAAWNDPHQSIIVYDTATTTGASSARALHITAFEMQVDDAPNPERKAHITAFELEAEPAAREAHVTAFEMEAEPAAREAHITAFEMQVYDAAQGDPVASLGRVGLGVSPIGVGL